MFEADEAILRFPTAKVNAVPSRHTNSSRWLTTRQMLIESGHERATLLGLGKKSGFDHMEYTFQKHSLSDAERLWLTEAIKMPNIDARVLKVQLLGKIPADFDDSKIDYRVWNNRQLTLIGLWLINPKDPIFLEIETIIKAIRETILKKPGIDVVLAADIAKDTGLNEKNVQRAFYHIAQLGPFSSGAGGSNDDPRAYISIALSGDKGYDAYLGFDGLFNVLERYYVPRAPNQRQAEATFPNVLFEQEGEAIDLFNQPMIRNVFKPNTAFVLMAIDRKNPENQDVYEAIKETCRRFEINAYRADEIEHQEQITTIVLKEIASCEFLIADLTHERPNVYYEIGYAHALNKRPILFRKAKTRLHFDLSMHNVPEYENITQLRELLSRRLESMLGKPPKAMP